MSEQTRVLSISSWSHGGASPNDPMTRRQQSADRMLTLQANGRFYRAAVEVPSDGALVINIVSPRPLRVYADGVLVIDEPLSWRSFQRQLQLAAAIPVKRGELELTFEVGARPRHPHNIDEDCPSRNRERVMREAMLRFPDRLELQLKHFVGANVSPVSLRFEPSQFRQEGIIYQHVLVTDLQSRFAPPQCPWGTFADLPVSSLVLSSSVLPKAAIDITAESDRPHGFRRLAVPVAEPGDMPAPVRDIGPDARIEPAQQIVRCIDLRVESGVGGVTIAMPAYESLGRLAPRKEYRELKWPTLDELLAAVPQPILPAHMSGLGTLYRAAWGMFLQLLRFPRKATGAINSYISTGASFGLVQFVWDSSFTTIAASYAWRNMPVHALLDNLYSRQFDGGYIHRENDWSSGLPIMYEPDFSPNPPLMSIAEWQIARLTGDVLRLRQSYPVLKANHQWLYHNRRLPDGTYWTTGLANGLDNSPSLGDGYPDLSAQMAHEAEVLARIAKLLGNDADATAFEREQCETGDAINRHLWSDSMRIYSTSLPGGGHNPNKVATAFWPLWAGVVPAQRVEDLAKHLTDPTSFWRHHPIPSLAADSPRFVPGGDYWRGSTWAPTNYAAIKGFDRAGRHDLAVKTTLRHLQCMLDVYQSTGQIWENYCSEKSERGSWSGSPYCWSALGPISLLIEVVIGIEVDAFANSITWRLPDEDNIGIRNLAMGANTISLQKRSGELQINAAMPFTLIVQTPAGQREIQCKAGQTVAKL